MPRAPDLRAEVESLLAYDSGFASDEHNRDFLRSPLIRGADTTAADVASGPARYRPTPSRIGCYRIICQMGEGGMGTVYEAEQDSPRRTVAIKVIRSDLVSPGLAGRFRNEAQILARLQHAGIAQVYEAGISEDGRPFFAMEIIRGVPLDEFAQSRRLDPRARMELVALVCDAVQHAHDKGVIHRDLKPANILVEESGRPRVLDFGVAHATAADGLATSSLTRTGELLGTLRYMSPEQLGGHPGGLDGRLDVYALGVILFELLAHRMPYQLDGLLVHEVTRAIEREEPTRLGSVDRRYRGDVEVIVARASRRTGCGGTPRRESWRRTSAGTCGARRSGPGRSAPWDDTGGGPSAIRSSRAWARPWPPSWS